MKNLLIIGGTYFLGRVFTIMACEAGYSLTLVNRGRYSMMKYGVKQELHFDRHDIESLRKMPRQDYDAVIDFCGYEPGDVKSVLDNLPSNIGQYIFISSSDVYDRSIKRQKDENTPLMTVQSTGAAGEYMFKKAQLDLETRDSCLNKKIPFTIIRPAFIYGPYNYAPRESYYIEKIVTNQPIPVPADSASSFQFVYVKDVSSAIMMCCEKDEAKNEAFNLSAPEIITYDSYMKTLNEVSDIPFRTYSVTVQEVYDKNLPLPFPLEYEENEIFDGSKIMKRIGFSYTSFRDGMEKTFRAFKSVYEG